MRTSALHGCWTTFIALAALNAVCGASDRNSPAERESEQALVSAVLRKLQERLPEPGGPLKVENRGGHLFLQGVVDMPLKKIIAGQAAESVRGVQSVTNRIDVQPERRPDSELARNVEAELRHDPLTSAFEIEARAKDGVVTLQGEVETAPAKRLATWVAAGVLGVREIVNEIAVRGAAQSDTAIRRQLLQAYTTSPLFNDDEITVEVKRGVVTLSGEVDTALEKTWARQDAFIPGVRNVDSGGLTVIPESAGTSRVEPMPLTDEDVRHAIERALAYDPRVASSKVATAVRNGVATLRGQVSNHRAKRAALEVARQTGGVREVVDEIELLTRERRSDAEIAADLKDALQRSAALANNRIDVQVSGGHVVLRGEVDSAFEKWSAENYADRAAGVTAMENRLTISGPR